MGGQDKYAYGLRFDLDYDYLKTTDFTWMFSKVRSELIRFLIAERLVTREDIKRKRLTFEVTQAQSGGSISIDIFPLYQAAYGAAWTLTVSIPVYDLLRVLHRWWRDRTHREDRAPSPFGVGRRNIRMVRTQVVRKELRPDGSLSSVTVAEREEEEINWK